MSESEEAAGRISLVAAGRSLHDRSLTPGSSGNISIRLDSGNWIVTPTGSILGRLNADKLSLLSESGDLLAGDAPTKEVPIHQAVLRQRPNVRAIVHLHSPYAVALSMLTELDPGDMLPAMTAYFVMRVGTLPLVPYIAPGDPQLGIAVESQLRRTPDTSCLLLANHGSVAAGVNLFAALDSAEEIEQTARLWFLTRGHDIRALTDEQSQYLRALGRI
jgi:3-dehydro-4-phosphotetronate decarboxylase